jgi:hypothetical protein
MDVLTSDPEHVERAGRALDDAAPPCPFGCFAAAGDRAPRDVSTVEKSGELSKRSSTKRGGE